MSVINNEQLKNTYGFDSDTKTVLFKVHLFMDSGVVHNCLVRSRSQSGALSKLMPPVNEVLTLSTFDGNIFGVRSENIIAVEFCD